MLEMTLPTLPLYCQGEVVGSKTITAPTVYSQRCLDKEKQIKEEFGNVAVKPPSAGVFSLESSKTALDELVKVHQCVSIFPSVQF